MKTIRLFLTGLAAWCASASVLLAQEVYPAAVLPFAERGSGVKGLGQSTADILFAQLAASPHLYLVERADLDTVLKEIELNLSGVVNPGQAVQVGQLTGAKILVTGSVIEAGDTLYLVAKIISSETSRVLGKSVKGKVDGAIDTLVEQLAAQVEATIRDRADEMVAKVVKVEDRIEAVKKALRAREQKGKLPELSISIAERHVGQVTIDPAAETEVSVIANGAGFTVSEKTKGKSGIRLVGEGFSEFASRRGNLVSVKARVELKAIDVKTGKVIAIDRQTAVEVDVSEQIAGKAALQEAAAILAERMLPKLVK